jgi:hypothetical protein
MLCGAVLQHFQSYTYVLRCVYLSVFPHVTARGLLIRSFMKLHTGEFYENLSTFQVQLKYGKKMGHFAWKLPSVYARIS